MMIKNNFSQTHVHPDFRGFYTRKSGRLPYGVTSLEINEFEFEWHHPTHPDYFGRKFHDPFLRFPGCHEISSYIGNSHTFSGI